MRGRPREIPVSCQKEYKRLKNAFLTALQIDNLGCSYWATPQYREYHRAHHSPHKPIPVVATFPNFKERAAATRRAKAAALAAITPEAWFFLMAAVVQRKQQQARRQAESHLRWCQNNPERRAAIERAKKHRRRARQRNAGGSFTGLEWLQLKERHGNRCLACGKLEAELVTLGRILAADHVQALARGGSNSISNIQPLCHGTGGCNNYKGDKHVDYRRAA